MRKLTFYSIVLVLFSVCSFEQSFCQNGSEREKLLLNRDAFLQSFEHFGYGIEKLGQPLMQVTPEKSHQIEGDVQVAWVKHYFSGIGSGCDVSTAVAIDKTGNIYVTGYSSSLPYGNDYLTIKYDALGNQIWMARYGGDGNGGDNLPSAISVDESGSVYVTGTSWSSDTQKDFAIVKYNSSGAQLWVARYSRFEASDDEAASLVVDKGGNSYVTGKSMGLNTGYDYATVKYNANGEMEWAAHYNGSGNSKDEANAIEIDDFGNICVTGYSSNQNLSWDYTTIKYDGQGNELWFAHYNGLSDGSDVATDLAIDKSGNVYITGYSLGEGDDYATIKYDSGGNLLWVARYNGTGNACDIATGLTVDGDENVYVTGHSFGLDTNFDYATIKYNSSGLEEWVAHYDGTANFMDVPMSIALDKIGNVYVSGTSFGLETNNDFTTIKYNNLGSELWIACYNRSGNSSDEMSSMAVDSSGNAVVIGSSWSLENDNDYLTIKYNANGLKQ
jgi:uncharacterized delta-60 repeat protein